MPRQSPGRPANDADTGKKLKDQPAKMFGDVTLVGHKAFATRDEMTIQPPTKAPPQFAQNSHNACHQCEREEAVFHKSAGRLIRLVVEVEVGS